ncbi:ras-GEF domain-containing family member 1B-like [Phlebotomus argentipes]|uniref:ras-GEF domain-containing family member 1B-like n=1 Tax=Phlebotomus argentipes TaxID=94469 RepID=UPI002892BC66|nr:ras-GEF domain-containing family member 1B-like [Phlebotomus argentipes]
MDEQDILKTVEAVLGKNCVIVDCETTSTVREEEVLTINGVPVRLDGSEQDAIRAALSTGQVPPCDLLNQILYQAGILRQPVRLETSLSIKSSIVHTEEVSVARDGRVLDERMCEKKESNCYTSSCTEVWEPVGSRQRTPRVTQKQGDTPSSSGCSIPAVSSCKLTADGRSTTSAATISNSDSGHHGNTSRATMRTPSSSCYDDFPSASEETPIFIKTAPQVSVDQHSDNQEDVGPNSVLVYRDGVLVAAPLEALIQHMVPTCDYYPEQKFLFAFLLSGRLFLKPVDLLAKVCHLGDMEQKKLQLEGRARDDGKLMCVVRNFVQLIAEWVETFPYDFRDDQMMMMVKQVTQKCIACDPRLRRDVTNLVQTLVGRLTKLDRYEEFLERLRQQELSHTTDIQQQSTTPSEMCQLVQDVTDICPNPTVLAHQLTHIELERLSYIGPEEFVQAFSKENPPNLTATDASTAHHSAHVPGTPGSSAGDAKKTRNLESYVQWFNRLSYMVATSIVRHGKKKQRVRLMEFWIEAARECFNIGNFNSLMAIVAGLNMSPISRLKKTWAKVQSAKFSILEHQMDPSSNFSSYRSTLKAAVWRSSGTTDERQRIVIPFFSLLVKDLYFLNQGCSNRLPNGQINFEKFWQLAKQIMEFISWKQVRCPFERHANIIKFLQVSPVLNENTLSMVSFELEQPENNHDKERYKTLKSEHNNH